jgi:hypothetical protein
VTFPAPDKFLYVFKTRCPDRRYGEVVTGHVLAANDERPQPVRSRAKVVRSTATTPCEVSGALTDAVAWNGQGTGAGNNEASSSTLTGSRTQASLSHRAPSADW